MPAQFEILEHPADVGFRAHGATLEELFASAALALISIAGEIEAIEDRERREIVATGDDTESLLYAWLAEIVAIADADRLVLRRVEVTSLGAGRVTGAAYGERYDRERHHSGTAIKAVTYHKFLVKQSGNGWIAEVFLDL
jgi:SHS2 domain-containing protein